MFLFFSLFFDKKNYYPACIAERENGWLKLGRSLLDRARATRQKKEKNIENEFATRGAREARGGGGVNPAVKRRGVRAPRRSSTAAPLGQSFDKALRENFEPGYFSVSLTSPLSGRGNATGRGTTTEASGPRESLKTFR